ncbi:MAG: lytic murein transglycosylase [Mesorhizobium sp.]|nr:MAG: lytic murein transglycosylase [Mesorhizobium sp.]
MKSSVALYGAPLCPAGHLPLKGGRSAVIAAFANFARRRRSGASKLPISPLEGEMPGRAEGGAVPPTSERT